MVVSPAGISLIEQFEGLRLTAYKDPVGIWTIGYGHTLTAKPGMTITKAKAEGLLREDLILAQTAIDSKVRTVLTQYEYDALACFTFNVGAGAFANSTLLHLLNAGDKTGAAEQFLRWDHAGGRVLTGLVARRRAERQLFLTPYQPPEVAS